jgi:hypothetical protein
MHTLKELVALGNKVRFTKYFDGQLWYKIHDPLAPKDFEFPVPISDIGNATFLAEDKALLFMRYIRNHLNMLAKARAEN